ncbi:TPA: hypothetical protein ACPZMC_003233 [Yersinia enterocolitica]|uniref:hypothetical protein n=1 Tax=Yersinia enterocolitica TaxID=630 RepID=UPI0005E5EBAD|nr:hypothetical protein [Yersinia enterocolitica]EKN3403883.1 hypothetical protein [Yersinia enterocolitica]EKN3717225.1 hypothetical protein [Yersinia enterocolitica]EKN4045431.1 hypothetical protein [Yersinia enterocolitica]EKN4823151.1 hypothetical protein [Yersinia enterocolitica]EKN4831159.1 hypothetical protein [Yersinia enterocolitica]
MDTRPTRQERKQTKIEKRREKSVRLAASFVRDIPQVPKIDFIPDLNKFPIVDAPFGSLDIPKQAKTNTNGSRFGYQMSWCARHADCDDLWQWGEPRQWSDQEWKEIVLSGMNSMQGLDWKEIQKMTSDTNHLMHHPHDVSDLCDEAVERWINLKLEQFDTVFRFRLGNTRRAWGIELQGHFYLIWYERHHNIYTV